MFYLDSVPSGPMWDAYSAGMWDAAADEPRIVPKQFDKDGEREAWLRGYDKVMSVAFP